ncbi:hypothetical protein SCATT_p10690 (plasmid) [Streptantibioticus cattleyicolor NRRL 8057 = DSM 46488]|uniref:ER-bound oxygenase mpaB/mpaB'/Rubber oxygenase catalytic domain-containing protein n=1 Tax=Streptantibioticus cattleyicolor (strain ATCC 35852 / DSM 46488 / JCM 4925 / NBRC 14057 / NRRL 8057) TaxID=1003195 RepID=F8JMU8_STREN|nr:hypothetical protein SCATT_p10690 [Streptantibioticus cattleyicolor NRRL 8057 = DSM 46488]CCB71695.1 conserved protein of unknown function [Streptantibioticus cattleyicolor NRRL 8057 = DSM 46488]
MLYRRLATDDFAVDLKIGLNLGFYRTFAVPAIARVLAGTGKMTTRPKVRAKVTGEMMYALIHHGLDAPRGQAVIDALVRLHAGLPAAEEDFVYVLAAFCVTPLRWIDQHAWRPTTRTERDAAHVFYAGLARRMGIDGMPDSYAELAAWMTRYETERFAPTPEGRLLLGSTRSVLADRFPRPVAPLAQAAFGALFDDRARRAFGMRKPGVPLRWGVAAALWARGRWMRRRRAGTFDRS